MLSMFSLIINMVYNIISLLCRSVREDRINAKWEKVKEKEN